MLLEDGWTGRIELFERAPPSIPLSPSIWGAVVTQRFSNSRELFALLATAPVSFWAARALLCYHLTTST